MPLIRKLVIADASPLIALSIVELLPHFPELLGEVWIPQTVFSECTVDLSKPGAKQIINAVKKGYLKLKQVKVSLELEELSQLLDRGEAEAICLALDQKCLLLIDEKKGRQMAVHRGLTIIGSMAVLLKAKEVKIIKQINPLLKKLDQQGYRLSDQLLKAVRSLAKEKSTKRSR